LESIEKMSNLLSKKSWHVGNQKNRERVQRDKVIEQEEQSVQEKKRKHKESKERITQFKKIKPGQEANIIDHSSEQVFQSSSSEQAPTFQVPKSKQQPSEGITFKSAIKYDDKSIFNKVVMQGNPIDVDPKPKSTKEEKASKPKQKDAAPKKTMEELMAEYLNRSKQEDKKRQAFLRDHQK